MEREKLIKIILGERYEEGKGIAEMVLDYVAENPDCLMGERKLFKDTARDALNNALLATFGHPLDYYHTKCRIREYAEVRQMSMHLFHKYTGYPLREVERIFNLNHSTVVHSYHQAENLLKYNLGFKENYKLLEQNFKKFL